MDRDLFWQQYAGQPYDLINGQVIAHVDKGFPHEVVTSRVQMVLSVHVEDLYLGEVFGTGARFALGNSHLRSADIAFVSEAKLKRITNPEAYLPFPPDLMVEIVSPRFTSTEIQQKALMFLEFGTQAVWIIDPDPKEVTVFLADGNIQSLYRGNLLDADPVIPGFCCKVDDLFPPLDLHVKYP